MILIAAKFENHWLSKWVMTTIPGSQKPAPLPSCTSEQSTRVVLGNENNCSHSRSSPCWTETNQNTLSSSLKSIALSANKALTRPSTTEGRSLLPPSASSIPLGLHCCSQWRVGLESGGGRRKPLNKHFHSSVLQAFLATPPRDVHVFREDPC